MSGNGVRWIVSRDSALLPLVVRCFLFLWLQGVVLVLIGFGFAATLFVLFLLVVFLFLVFSFILDCCCILVVFCFSLHQILLVFR
jgi:hypothetical protein